MKYITCTAGQNMGEVIKVLLNFATIDVIRYFMSSLRDVKLCPMKMFERDLIIAMLFIKPCRMTKVLTT